MTLKEYGAVLTGIVVSMVGFDFIWFFSSMDALKGAFAALLIGVLAAVVFAIGVEAWAERRNGSKHKATYVTDEETGLMYMPMKHGRGVN